VYDVREVLEGLAARRGAKAVDDVLREVLRAILDRHDRHVAGGDRAGHTDQDMAFHRRLRVDVGQPRARRPSRDRPVAVCEGNWRSDPRSSLLRGTASRRRRRIDKAGRAVLGDGVQCNGDRSLFPVVKNSSAAVLESVRHGDHSR
jgi:hypothetical protein